MKVLVLTITAGQGHHSTGRALIGHMQKSGIECEMVDAYEYVAHLLKEAIAQGYLISTAYAPKAMGTIYRLAETRKSVSDRMSLMNLYNTVLSYELIKHIDDYKPDVIVCTHVFAAGIVNVLKKKGKISCKSIGIVTDFTLHPFWEDLDCIDYFVMASELLSYAAGKRGISEDRILPVGIPINPKFSADIDKDEVKKELGLDPSLKTVLIMSGSMGYGKMDKVIKDLDDMQLPFQAMVVCGNNEVMYKKISKMKTRKPFKVYGFVDNVDVLMSAADCIVTKPGGLTSSEALAKELPMIMVNPIPGQEERNVEFMINNALAMYATETMPVDELLYMLFTDKERLGLIRDNIKRIGKKNSAEELCKFILKLGNR